MTAPACEQSWFVYLLECGDGTYYTGVARDVSRRLTEHRVGKGARYTRGRGPLRLLAESPALDKIAAHRLEAQVKRLPRPKKRKAVASGGSASLGIGGRGSSG